MSKPSKPEYAEIIDDVYLTYVQLLSTQNDADFADFIAEYAVPGNGTAPVHDDGRQTSVTTSPPPEPTTFRRAA